MINISCYFCGEKTEQPPVRNRHYVSGIQDRCKDCEGLWRLVNDQIAIRLLCKLIKRIAGTKP